MSRHFPCRIVHAVVAALVVAGLAPLHRPAGQITPREYTARRDSPSARVGDLDDTSLELPAVGGAEAVRRAPGAVAR